MTYKGLVFVLFSNVYILFEFIVEVILNKSSTFFFTCLHKYFFKRYYNTDQFEVVIMQYDFHTLNGLMRFCFECRLSASNQGETQLQFVFSQSGRHILNFIRQIINLSANTENKNIPIFYPPKWQTKLNFIRQGRILSAFVGKADFMSCPASIDKSSKDLYGDYVCLVANKSFQVKGSNPYLIA